MQSTSQDIVKNAAVQWELTVARFEEWSRYVFHFKWWLLLAVFILSALIWWKLIDKSKLVEIVVFTGITCIIVLALDELGEELTLWDYPIELIPLFPPISSIDLASLPMIYSLIYQYFYTWKSFAIASFIFSVFSCFVFEPLFVLVGIYQMITWKSYYGLPIYFAIALFSKGAVALMSRIEKNINHNNLSRPSGIQAFSGRPFQRR
ncbi:CBO0543 family protein [Caproicibacter sp. BJN0012]|uniref:CBO0543 family protein n=1 Tax=Caproicibacter sp. BJN0012 TaxID=3110227 RepID=UPI002E12330D